MTVAVSQSHVIIIHDLLQQSQWSQIFLMIAWFAVFCIHWTGLHWKSIVTWPYFAGRSTDWGDPLLLCVSLTYSPDLGKSLWISGTQLLYRILFTEVGKDKGINEGKVIKSRITHQILFPNNLLTNTSDSTSNTMLWNTNSVPNKYR